MQFLIIEDSDYKRDAIYAALRDLGYVNIAFAKNTVQGLRALESNSFDVLILDNNFPLRDGEFPKRDAGLSLLRRLDKALSWQEVASKIKVILCSSDDLDTDTYDYVNVIGTIKYNVGVDLHSCFENIL